MSLKKSSKAGLPNPAKTKEFAEQMMDDYRIPIRRACKLVLLHRSMWYYQSQAKDEQAIRKRMREIAMTRVRYGLDRIHVLLRREVWRNSRNRIYRLYKLEGLNLRSKRPKRNRCCSHRLNRLEVSKINQSWSMDFVADQLFDGRRFRALTVAAVARWIILVGNVWLSMQVNQSKAKMSCR